MEISVKPFIRGNVEEIARKVCEEAMEFYAEHHNYMMHCTEHDEFDTELEWLMCEIGDVFTAMMNYCNIMAIEPQECVVFAQTKNLARGYYGNPHDVAVEWTRDAREDSSSAQCGDTI